MESARFSQWFMQIVASVSDAYVHTMYSQERDLGLELPRAS